MPEKKDSREKTTGKQRDEKGRFLPGNKEGHRFLPGNKASPGRPVTRHIAKKLESVNPKDEHGRTNGELVADRLLEMAMNGHLGAIQEVTNRVEGKVTDKLEHSGPGGGPIPIEQKRIEEYGSVLGRLAGVSAGTDSGKPVDTPQPD